MGHVLTTYIMKSLNTKAFMRPREMNKKIQLSNIYLKFITLTVTKVHTAILYDKVPLWNVPNSICETSGLTKS